MASQGEQSNETSNDERNMPPVFVTIIKRFGKELLKIGFIECDGKEILPIEYLQWNDQQTIMLPALLIGIKI